MSKIAGLIDLTKEERAYSERIKDYREVNPREFPEGYPEIYAANHTGKTKMRISIEEQEALLKAGAKAV